MSEPIEREIHIDAAPETVFEFFTDASKLTRWLAVEATLDPRPGGVCHQLHVGDQPAGSTRYPMRGEFVDVDPPKRVSFTWGFANEGSHVPPGSTLVEVTLTPRRGGTHVRLVHSGLPDSERDAHAGGWTRMLGRLAAATTAEANA